MNPRQHHVCAYCEGEEDCAEEDCQFMVWAQICHACMVWWATYNAYEPLPRIGKEW